MEEIHNEKSIQVCHSVHEHHHDTYYRGGISVAQPGGGATPVAYNPLPSNLRRGINIPWVFGNASYLFAWNTAAYSPERLNNLLTIGDFNAIRNSQTTLPKFDHVRILIDLQCFMVGPDGAVPPMVNSPFPALRATIDEALGQGLAVVIALHPPALNQFHFDKINKRKINGVDTNPWYHPLTYGLPFVTSEPASGPVPDNHPLVKFWETFAPYIADYDKSKVYLSLCDEPLAAYENGNMYPQGSGVDEQLVMKPHRQNWKNIQLKVIQKLRNHEDARIRDFWLITSTYTGQPQDIDGWEGITGGLQTGDYKPHMVPPAEIEPYSNEEVPDGRIIYGFSFYYPFRYTHWDWTRKNEPGYFHDPGYDISLPTYPYNRDFKGATNTALTPSYPPEEYNAYYSNWGYDRSMKQLVDEMADFQLVTEEFGGGLSAEYWVPVYIAGFGSQIRQGTIQDPESDDFDPFSGGNLYDDGQRECWYFDARFAFEQRGFGWATWEIFGGFYQVWTGRLSPPGNITTSIITQHGDWQTIDSNVQGALFGPSRPQ